MRQPIEEIASVAVAAHPRPPARTVLRRKVLAETAACHAHTVGYTFDERPVRTFTVVAAASFGLELVGMGKLVVKHATRLIIDSRSVVTGETVAHPVDIIVDSDMVSAAALIGYAVEAAHNIVDVVNVGNTVGGREIEGLYNAPGVVGYVSVGILNYGAIYLCAFAFRIFYHEMHAPGIIVTPLAFNGNGCRKTTVGQSRAREHGE